MNSRLCRYSWIRSSANYTERLRRERRAIGFFGTCGLQANSVFSRDFADRLTGLFAAPLLMARVSNIPTSIATAATSAGLARTAADSIRMIGVISVLVLCVLPLLLLRKLPGHVIRIGTALD